MSREIEQTNQQYSQLTDQGDQAKYPQLLQDPISLYNKVISIYNLEDNKVDGITLNYMTQSNIVKLVDLYIRNYKGIIAFIIILLFIPIINALLFIFICVACVQIVQNYSIFKQNLASVLDPFANMIENSDLCQIMQKDYVIFDMEIKENDGLHFSNQVKEMIKNRSKGNNKIKYTIYNYTLKEQFYGYPNKRIKYYFWIILSILLIGVQSTLLTIYFSKK